jgi:hypothetical protein
VEKLEFDADGGKKGSEARKKALRERPKRTSVAPTEVSRIFSALAVASSMMDFRFHFVVSVVIQQLAGRKSSRESSNSPP